MLLDGVRVLDLSRLLPGGYCTLLLQAQGALVTKIEPPGGDPLRHVAGGAAYFEALHRNKQLRTVDLKNDAGRASLKELVATADVLVEGFRPGVMERIQLGYAVLSAINPGLVYCAITGYGARGPMANRAGHDLNYRARSGALSLMPNANGVPVIPGLQVADLAGGQQAAFLIAAALAGRATTGKGTRLEVSMTGLMHSWTLLPRAARAAGLPGLSLTGELPCYRVYRVADGLLTVAALESDFWREFCHAIERDDLIDRQFDPSAIPDVEATLRSRSQQDWIARFADRDVCVEPVLALDAADAD